MLTVLFICLYHVLFFQATAFSPNGVALKQSSMPLQALVPLDAVETQALLSTGAPTGQQYATYWGRTSRERYGRVLGSTVVSFLGVFFSYFLSFIIGGFVATILGCLFVFWAVLSPELQAYQRNWEFLGGRALVDVNARPGNGLYSALFLGHISDVCVVEDASDDVEYDLAEFSDYTMEEDDLEKLSGNPYLLRIRCSDKTGRQLQLHARMSETYVEDGALSPGTPVTSIVLSKDQSFDRLAAISDLYVPNSSTWIGDYPYLNRNEMEILFMEDDELWDDLQAEWIQFPNTQTTVHMDNSFGDLDASSEKDMLPVKKRSL